MAKFDKTLRDIIQNIPQKFISILTDKKGSKILDNTFPSTKERLADLVLELEDGSVFHLELQTQNDKNMPFRMLEYYLLLKQRYPDKLIKQMVLYVGDGKPNMQNYLETDKLKFSYEIKDIKDIECKELLESDSLEDKILAVLCKVEDFETYIFSLIDELLKLSEKQRADYIRKLLIALNYRPKLKVKLKTLMEERKMPLTITEEMAKEDPFYDLGFKKAKKEDIIKLYKKLKLNPEQIADILDLPLDFVEKVIEETNSKNKE
ncbi:hypothetical protein [Persephonella sp. KM09-Lau-8]|uniref:hypothetical protein n=1 Tax=Persephonella sp. KM09-Lau-8 TaxID=1158345 RepID=UPI00068FD0D3|nr:hypothetical protein [Persephonella sp. KM09-Lau-8]